LITETTRSHDLVCRVGGDGFAILLPEADSEAPVHVCRRLKAALAEQPPGPLGGVQVSLGVATLGPKQAPDELLAAAHAALEQARAAAGGPILAEPAGPEADAETPTE
jgi:diguanylate cyclase (GGDEF)-like protein